MSTEIIKVLDALCDKIGIAIDWSAENITPQMIDVFTRYGHYLFFDAVFSSCCGFFMLLFGVILFPITYKSQEKKGWAGKKGFCSDLGITAYISAWLLIFFGFIFFVCGTSDAIKGYIVPEVLAAQKIMEILQNGG